jgi:hypothetical protein
MMVHAVLSSLDVFGTQLNFVRACACQAEDKIMLLPDSYLIVIGTKSLCDFQPIFNPSVLTSV